MEPEIVDLPPALQHSHLERVLMLRAFPGLAHLAPAQLAAIAEHARERFFIAGSDICAEGEPVRELHYLLEGDVAVRRDGVTIAELGERSVIGGLASLASLGDGQQVVALTDCTTLAMTLEDQTEVFEDNFEMLLAVLRAVARALLQSHRRAGPGGGFNPATQAGWGDAVPGSLTVVHKLAYLRRSMSFAASGVEGLAELAREATEQRFAAGTALWKIGEPSGKTLLIVAGVIAGETDEKQKFRFVPGDIAGGLDSLAEEPRWYDAVCESDVVAIEIDVEVFYDILEDNTDMALGFLRVLADATIKLRELVAGTRRPPSGPVTGEQPLQ